VLSRRLSVAFAMAVLFLLAGCESASRAATNPPALRLTSRPSPSPTAVARLTAQPATLHGDGPSGSIRTTGTAAVALTFDDGPSPVWTPRILKLLAKYHVHATFCMIGEQVAEYPYLVREVVAAGDTLCNHSWDHDEFMDHSSAHHIRAEMTRTLAALHKAAPGAPVRYYRQPGGNWSRAIVATARSLGMSPLDWSVDPADWQKPPAADIVHDVKSTTHPGSIILDHDGGGDRSRTYAALTTLLPYLRHRYELIRL
jgi:peptidoglycan-N-acetylglucosamine deacetylase